MKDIKIYAFADEASEKIDLQIEAIKKNKLDGLEIRNVDGINVSEITTEKAKEVRKKLDDNGLITWSIGSPIGKINIDSDDFKKHIDLFSHTLEIANILNAKNLRMFSFFIDKEKNYDDYKNEVIDRLGILNEEAKKANITLCHENEKGIFGDTPERCIQIYKNIPDIKNVFDPANFVQCSVDTIKAFEDLKVYTKYMHIKDSLKNHNVVPAGMGDGNVKYIANEFLKMGLKNFTIEPHLMDFVGLKGLENGDDTSVVGQEFKYSSSFEAFDDACKHFRELI